LQIDILQRERKRKRERERIRERGRVGGMAQLVEYCLANVRPQVQTLTVR
jgi:hypothetical protein